MERQEKQDETIRKLKKQLKLYMKRVEDFEGKHTELTAPFQCIIIMALIPSLLLCLATVQRKNSASVMNAPLRAVNITRKEKDYQGMLEYRAGDESRLLKNLVIGIIIAARSNYYLILFSTLQRYSS